MYFLFKMEIFYCYVSFPEGNQHVWSLTARLIAPDLCISLGCADGLWQLHARATSSSQQLSGEGETFTWRFWWRNWSERCRYCWYASEIHGEQQTSWNMVVIYTTNIYSSAPRVTNKFQVVFCRVSEKTINIVSPGVGNDLAMIWRIFNNHPWCWGGMIFTHPDEFRRCGREQSRDPIRGAIEKKRGPFSIFSAGLNVFQAKSKSPKSVSKTFASWFWCMIKTHPKILLKMAFFCQVFDEKSDFFASATATPPKVVPRLQRIATSCRLAPKPIC